MTIIVNIGLVECPYRWTYSMSDFSQPSPPTCPQLVGDLLTVDLVALAVWAFVKQGPFSI